MFASVDAVADLEPGDDTTSVDSTMPLDGATVHTSSS